MPTATAAPAVHLTQRGRRFRPGDFADRSIWSVERSGPLNFFDLAQREPKLYRRP